jgi:hypothetical protein
MNKSGKHASGEISSFNETTHDVPGLVALDDAALELVVGGGTCPSLSSCTDNIDNCPNLSTCNGNSGCMGLKGVIIEP